MKSNIIFLFVFLFASVSCTNISEANKEITQEDYSVYSALIKEFFSDIQYYTGTIPDPPKSENEKVPSLDKIKVFSKKAKNIVIRSTLIPLTNNLKAIVLHKKYTLSSYYCDGVKLEKCHFKIKRIKLIGEKAITKILGRGRDNWHSFNTAYPESTGLISFSKVFFTPNKQKALVYAIQIKGLRAASGCFFYLVKKRGEWIISDIDTHFVS